MGEKVLLGISMVTYVSYEPLFWVGISSFGRWNMTIFLRGQIYVSLQRPTCFNFLGNTKVQIKGTVPIENFLVILFF